MARREVKRTNSDLQSITETTNDRATRTPLNTGVNSGAPEGKAVPPPIVDLVVLLFLQTRSLVLNLSFI